MASHPFFIAYYSLAYSISKSIMSRRRAADSAKARQGEGNNDTIDLETELHTIAWSQPITLSDRGTV